MAVEKSTCSVRARSRPRPTCRPTRRARCGASPPAAASSGHRRCGLRLDVRPGDVLLDPDLEARLELAVAQHLVLLERGNRLVREDLGKGVGGRLQVLQPALLGLGVPRVVVVVATEDDSLRLACRRPSRPPPQPRRGRPPSPSPRARRRARRWPRQRSCSAPCSGTRATCSTRARGTRTCCP